MFRLQSISGRASILSVLFVCAALFLQGCNATLQLGGGGDGSYRLSKRDATAYEEAGKWWGTKHWNMPLKPNGEDPRFTEALIDSNNLDFFWIHAELKDAFRKGYRIGYQDRTADLVLGPSLTAAAKAIGEKSGTSFVEVVKVFEKDWAETLKRAVGVFIALISEGSQADREQFIANFVRVYDQKYKSTQQALRVGGFVRTTSEGGTTLLLDARKTLAVLDIPSTEILKTEIYHQTFNVMGDEWGRRLSHNLIKRDELLDLLRRSKTAFDEVQPGLAASLGIVKSSFVAAYGTDAENVFAALLKDAGYTVMPRSPAPRKR